jgi:hypothetical protein
MRGISLIKVRAGIGTPVGWDVAKHVPRLADDGTGRNGTAMFSCSFYNTDVRQVGQVGRYSTCRETIRWDGWM